MSAFLNYCRIVRRSSVRVGERVRIVDMNGCMATVRTNVREGIVRSIEVKQVYGDVQSRPWAAIAIDKSNGVSLTVCAEHTEWIRGDDGVMENRR